MLTAFLFYFNVVPVFKSLIKQCCILPFKKDVCLILFPKGATKIYMNHLYLLDHLLKVFCSLQV